MSRYQIFDAFVDVIIILDKSGSIVYGNAAATALFGVSQKRLSSGKHYSQFISLTPDPFQEAGDLESVVSTQIREVEFQLIADSRKGSLQIFLQKQPDYFVDDDDQSHADPGRWIVYIRDVSLEMTLHNKYRAEFAQKEKVIKDLETARAQLEKYSQELEARVAERTAALQDLNRLQKTILDSLGQGILVFDSTGKCLPVYSSICVRLCGVDPSGMQIEDVFKLTGQRKESFMRWRELAFEDLLDFEDLIRLTDPWFKHPDGFEISIAYCPMRLTSGSIDGMVVVLTDRTNEMKALREAQAEREVVVKVTRVTRNRDSFRVFVGDCREMLRAIPGSLDESLETVMRNIHTIKGGASSFGLIKLASACHELEDSAKVAKDTNCGPVEIKRLINQALPHLTVCLDDEIGSLTELVGSIGITGGHRVDLPVDLLLSWSQSLKQAPTPQTALEVARAIAVESSERKIADVIGDQGPSLKDFATTLGKQLKSFHFVGGDLRIPIGYGESFFSTLIHGFRNSISHGLESIEERSANGKEEGGAIVVRASEEVRDDAIWLALDISDDGRGVNPKKVRAKLIEKGLDALASGDDEQVIQTILRGDLSTAEEISIHSGRGVGLSAITEQVRLLGGHIRVRSTFGKGMTLEIRVPVRALNSKMSHAA